MDYETTLEIQGDPREALLKVRRRLALEDWFDQSEEIDNGIRLRRAMPLVRSGRHRAIQALAAVQLVPMGRQLLVRGEYARVGRFLLWFLPSLALLLGGTFAAAGMFQALWVLPLVFAPWIVLGPLLVRFTQARARRALDGLVREALDGALPAQAAAIREATSPIDVRGDLETSVTASGDPARAIVNLRNLIAKDFRFGSTGAGGFVAAKPWIGIQGGERLPFIGRLEVATGGGREVLVRADYTGIGLIAGLIGGGILIGVGVLVYFLMTMPAARTGLMIGLACCAPELILLPFIPVLLRRYARGRLERLLKMAA